MPWFLYNFPGNPNNPGSYQFIAGPPTCTGNTLCAVNTDIVPETDPSQPDLDKPGVRQAINDALNGIITSGVTRLRQSR